MEITYKSVTGENIKVVVPEKFEGVMMQLEKTYITTIKKKLGDIKA